VCWQMLRCNRLTTTLPDTQGQNDKNRTNPQIYPQLWSI
jgi:hypothetical protein